MTNFPTNLDSLINPTAGDTVQAIDHAAQHANVNDAIIALETKVGKNSSAENTSHDYKLSGISGSDKASSLAGIENISNKTITLSTIPDTNVTFTDNTSGNVSATAHGFAPKFPNNTTTFLRGDGTYASTPSGTPVHVYSATGASGTTLSISPNGSQVVVAWAKGDVSGGSGGTINLQYNGVTKDSIVLSAAGIGFYVQYTETPSAGTHNISLSIGGNTVENISIIAMLIG
jgi:hypothetical protein